MIEIGKFVKRSEERLDYNIDFSLFLDDIQDTLSTFSVVAPTGLTITDISETGGVVTFWVEDGVPSSKYLVKTTIDTTGGRIKSTVIEISIERN